MSDPSVASHRLPLLRRGQRLVYFTIAWNVVETGVAVGSGIAAGSIALIGFGLDSLIETFAALVLVRHQQREFSGRAVSEASERRAVRLIGLTFFALAAYITLAAGIAFWQREEPAESLVGIALAVLSLLIMPFLAWRKRTVAHQLGSAALREEATETLVCSYLSFALLLGLGCNALLGWWWADPAAALAMVPFVLREGWEDTFGEEEEGLSGAT